MLEFLLIPLMLPSYPPGDNPPLPQEVEVALGYQSRNPYKCAGLIGAYVDEMMAADPAGAGTEPREGGAAGEGPENPGGERAAPPEEGTAGAGSPPAGEPAEPREEDPDGRRFGYLVGAPTAENLNVYNALNSCRIKAGLEPDGRLLDLAASGKIKNPEVIRAARYDRVRALAREGRANGNIRVFDNPRAGDYAKIKPYIQLLELYKLGRDDNLKAVRFFENSVNDPDFETYPDPVKTGFWLQGFGLYRELNHGNTARYFLGLAEKNLSGKAQYRYDGALVYRLLYELARGNLAPDRAAGYLSVYLARIESIPEENGNYIDGLISLGDLRIRGGRDAEALALLKKADNLAAHSDLPPERLDRARKSLAALYVDLGEYGRALDLLRDKNSSYSFDSSDPESFGSMLDLSAALNGAGQTKSAEQLMRSLGGYMREDLLDDSVRRKYYRTAALILAGEKKFAEAYDMLLKAVAIPDREEKYRGDGRGAPVVPAPARPAPYRPGLGAYNLDVPVRMIVTTFAGAAFVFLALLLAAMRYYNRSRELSRELDKTKEDYALATSAVWNNYNDFMNFVVRQSMNYHQGEGETGGRNIEYINSQALFEIFVPGFAELAIHRGDKEAQSSRNIFLEKLKKSMGASAEIYVITDTRFIIAASENADTDIATSAAAAIAGIEQALGELRVPPVVNIGAINYPFLYSEPYSLESSRVYELLTLALAGAVTISPNRRQSTFVRLSANRLDKAALLNGETYERAVSCIRKGSITAFTVPENSIIDWQQVRAE